MPVTRRQVHGSMGPKHSQTICPNRRIVDIRTWKLKVQWRRNKPSKKSTKRYQNMPKKPYIMEARPQRHVPRWYSPPIWIDTQICQEGAPRPNRLSFEWCELQRWNLWRWIEDMEVNEHIIAGELRWMNMNVNLGTWMNYFQELAEELCSTSGLHHCCLQRPPAHVWYSKIVYREECHIKDSHSPYILDFCAQTYGQGLYTSKNNETVRSFQYDPCQNIQQNGTLMHQWSPSHNPTTTAARSTHIINSSDTLFRAKSNVIAPETHIEHARNAALGSHAESLWNNGAKSCRLFE